jgi:hypothetical protein
MTRQELRLECLRIAASLDVPAERIGEIAETLFRFLEG